MPSNHLSLKKIYSFILTLFVVCGLSAQSYTLSPTHLNVQGNPGDFMLSTLVVNNPSASQITIHMERIVKNLPANWTSCFCFPTCIAPFIDTLTFSIAAYSNDSIKPNYGTDPNTPGIGYITIKLYQEGFPNAIDTVYFSGSTLSTSGVNEVSYASNFAAYPNPFNDVLTVCNKNMEDYTLSVYNSTGEIVFRKENISAMNESVDLSFLCEGIYFVKSEFTSGKTVSNRIVKSK